MAVTLDMFEYADDLVAQAAYVASDPEVVDQNYEAGYDGYNTLGDSGGTDRCYAQIFTTGATILLSSISIYLGASSGSPTGDVTFRIETNVDNKPSGTLVHANATYVLPNADVVESAWNKVNFAPFSLVAGTYWIVVLVDNQDIDVYWYWYRDNNSGTNTSAYSTDGGSSWVFMNHKSYYRVYALHLQCYSEDTIKQEGSYALKGMAVITASLNDTLTRAVSPTIDLSNQIIIEFDIWASQTGSNIKIGIHDSGGVTTEITPNILVANTWQRVEWVISNVADVNKDVIDQIIITIVNADSDNTFYLDNMFAIATVALEENLALLENLPTLARALTITESLALLESLPVLERGLSLTELLALKEEETADVSSLLTESLGLLESLPTLERALTLEEALALKEKLAEFGFTLEESLALLEDLPILERGLTLTEALALLESETVDVSSVLTENLALKEDLTQLGRTLTLEESLALLEDAHAETLLFEVDKDGNIIYMGTLDEGAFL